MARLSCAVALAVTAGLAVAGCTSGGAGSTKTGTGAASTAPALTTAQARQVFDSYVTGSETAARTGDVALALSDVTGVQRSYVTATFKADRYDHVRLPYPYYTYGRPVFYLPAAAGYPRFFVADVSRVLAGTKLSDAIATRTAGVTVPLDGNVLMLFEQAGRTQRWRLASTSQFIAGTSLPPLATNGGGHVLTLPLSTGTLLAPPDVVGPLQAAVVDDGPSSPAASAVAGGPLTTGIYQAARTSVQGIYPPRGDVLQWALDGADYGRFVLRTAGGGALVFYSMYLDTTVEVPAVLNDAEPVSPGPPITVPADLMPLLTLGEQAPRVELEGQDLLSFAAIDPPPGSAKIQVIAIGGGLDYASAS